MVEGQADACRYNAAGFALDRPKPCVTGGHAHDASRPHQQIDFDTKRALAASEPLRLKVITHAHVHTVDEDLAPVPIDLLNIVDCGNDAARPPVPELVEDFEANQLGLGRDARDLLDVGCPVVLDSVIGGAASGDGHDGRGAPNHFPISIQDELAMGCYPGDDPGDVGAMSKRILFGRTIAKRLVSEWRLELHIRMSVEMGVGYIYAGIHHRPDNALAKGAKRLLRGICLHRGDRLRELRLDFKVWPDMVDGAVYRACRTQQPIFDILHGTATGYFFFLGSACQFQNSGLRGIGEEALASGLSCRFLNLVSAVSDPLDNCLNQLDDVLF